MSTPILPFAVWQSGTNENSLPANDNALRAEILNGFVISDVVTAQPGAPDDGDIYIIPAGATGAQWSLFDEFDLAIFKSGTWTAYAPVEGIVVNLAGGLVAWDGAAYIDVTGGGGGVTDGDKGDIVVSGGGTTWGIDFTASTFDNDPTLAASSASRLATQQAVKTYVDSLITGLSWKRAVRAGTTANGTLASAFQNGSTIDGVTLATGDRILIKNQTTGSENGIYVVQASGAPVRSSDADTGAELVNATVFISEGTTLADTQWTCSTNPPITVGTTALTWVQLAAGGGGLSNWTDGVNTATPNATVPVVSLTVTNAATNVDAAIVPKGTGAFALSVADNTDVGGNKRGAYAVDLQRDRSAGAQVAAADHSFVVGAQNSINSTSSYAVAMGLANTINSASTYSGAFGTQNTIGPNSNYSFAFGTLNSITARYSAAFGSNNSVSEAGLVAGSQVTVDGLYGFGSGYQALQRGFTGGRVHASGRFSANGDAQERSAALRASTTNATATRMTSDQAAASTSNQFVLPNSSAYLVRGDVIARENATGDCKGFEFVAVVKRGANAAATALVGSGTVTTLFADAGAAAWAVSLTADTTNGALGLVATGEAAKNIKWVARVRSVEVVG